MNISLIYKQFPTEEDCYAFLEQQRWGSQPVCPYCGSANNSRCKNQKRHHCSSCNRSFSVLVDTVMQATKLPLQKWLLAMSIMLNARKGVASRQLARDLGIHRNSAWLLQMRIRNAMAEVSALLSGSDLGKKVPKTREKSRKTKDSPAIAAAKSRGEELAATLRNWYGKRICPAITQTLDQKNPLVYHGEFRPPASSNRRPRYFPIRSIENFWFLMKRGLLGQYHQLNTTYLQAYMDEFAFKYAHRKNPEVFDLLVRSVSGGTMPQNRTCQ